MLSSLSHTQATPFRAENVGSFLRPAPLYAKRKEMDSNECTSTDLKGVEDEAIMQVVKFQREVGIRTITDGELRRYCHLKASQWHSDSFCNSGATSSMAFLTSLRG